ncbi:MAG: hypothetical protein QM737_18590 [Ferruginibacter sp.]
MKYCSIFRVNKFDTKLIVFMGLLLLSCSQTRKSQQLFPSSIDGTWDATGNSFGFVTRMEFYPGGVTFYNTGDTLLNYAIKLKNDSLILRDKNNVVNSYKILNLTNDSFILRTLLWDTTIQSFVRVKHSREKH